MILPPYRRGDLKDQSVETPSITASFSKAWHRSSLCRSSSGYQWHSLDFTQGVLRGEICALCYGPWQTVSGRFYRAAKTGNLAKHLTETTTASRAKGKNQLGYPRSLMAVLGHQHAAGAMRGELDPNSELSAIEQVHYSWSFGVVKRGFQYQNSSTHSMAMDYP